LVLLARYNDNMSFWVALLIYLLFMGGYWFFVWSIHWHAREYIMPNDPSSWITDVFLVSAAVLSIISLGLFFTLPLAF